MMALLIERFSLSYQEFERQREELVQKKARAAERAARDARRIASLPIITDYSRATRSRTKVNYAEVSSHVSAIDLYIALNRCLSKTRPTTMMTARSNMSNEARMETYRTPKIIAPRRSRPSQRLSLTVETLEIAEPALSQTDTATRLEARRLRHMVTLTEMLVELRVNLQAMTKKPCMWTTMDRTAGPGRTEMHENGDIAIWKTTNRMRTRRCPGRSR